MILDLGSASFNLRIEEHGATPSWGTSVGQGADYKFKLEEKNLYPLLASMAYCAVEDPSRVTGPFGKGGNKRDCFSLDMIGHYSKIYANNKLVEGAEFLLLLVREVVSKHHEGRRTLKYHEKYCLDGRPINKDCYEKVAHTLNISANAAWFINSIEAKNQDELYFEVIVMDSQKALIYKDNDERQAAMGIKLQEEYRRNFGGAATPEASAKDIQDEFKYFLSNCMRSSRRNRDEYNYGESAISSNLVYTKSQNLLGPCSSEWPAFKSLYDIREFSELDRFMKELWSHAGFKFYDESKGQWPSTTLINYACFLKARNYFSKSTQVELPSFKSSKNLPSQLIYFGAPGTSKSTTIKREVGRAAQHRVTFHPDTDYASFVGCYKPTQNEGESEITYKFVAQAFIEAYVEAWTKLYSTDENRDVFLIIEEINRGNCAQIFGDLFQLLDRDERGYSDYEIVPDSDLQRHLRSAFENVNVDNEAIRSGSIMLLPPNLYIWATMNTSDQSLFPIDSAFKRRWQWKYLPIRNERKGHLISMSDDTAYDWWEFLSSVNARIEKVTESEDKQLGYWFAKPDDGIVIGVETLVGKVIFYLWNDVFKDFPRNSNSPFTIKKENEKNKELKFRDFYDEEGEVNEAVVREFLEGLGLQEQTPEERNAAQTIVHEDVEETAHIIEEPRAEYDTSREDDNEVTTVTQIDDLF